MAHSGLDPSTSISNYKNACTDIPMGQADGGNVNWDSLSPGVSSWLAISVIYIRSSLLYRTSYKLLIVIFLHVAFVCFFLSFTSAVFSGCFCKHLLLPWWEVLRCCQLRSVVPVCWGDAYRKAQLLTGTSTAGLLSSELCLSAGEYYQSSVSQKERRRPSLNSIPNLSLILLPGLYGPRKAHFIAL